MEKLPLHTNSDLDKKRNSIISDFNSDNFGVISGTEIQFSFAAQQSI